MFTTPAAAASTASCCATVIPTHRRSVSARVERLLGRLIDAIAAWRRRRHDARYLGYLGEAELREIGLTPSMLRNMGMHTRSAHRSGQERFPF